jgi:outer membrane protein, heavy metal efflux system
MSICRPMCLLVAATVSGHLLQAQNQLSPVPETVIPSILTLAIAEQLLLQRSQFIAGSRHQLEVSQALRLIAGYKPNPIVHLAAEQLPFRSNVPGIVPRFFGTTPEGAANPTYTGQVTKVIERGGKRELRVQQASAGVDVSRALILDTFRVQLFLLRQAFNTALLARENLQLAQSIDAQYTQTERLTNVRVEAGDVAAVELLRVRAARLPFRQAVFDAQAAYEQATRDILNVLNTRPDQVPEISGGAGQPALANSLALTSVQAGISIPIQIDGQFNTGPVLTPIAELRRTALDSRPDVAAARSALRAAESGSALARALRTRDIAVGAEYQRVGSDHSVGVITEFPLFVYNNQKGAIAQASAAQRFAEAQLRQVETQALTDVEKAYQAYLAARRSLSIYGEEGLATTEKMRSVVEFSYQKGEASLFELLDAQRTASQSRVAANQARAAHALAIWQLEQAIGQPLP